MLVTDRVETEGEVVTEVGSAGRTAMREEGHVGGLRGRSDD